MKNLLLLILLFSFFSSDKSFSQVCPAPPPITTCRDTFTPNGTGSVVVSPNPYIEATGFAGIERYLARTMHMEALVRLIGNDTIKCRDYEESINMAAELNAAYLTNVTDYYGSEEVWAGSDTDRTNVCAFRFLKSDIAALRKVVKDINFAYDRRSLRHPIIDAFVQETVDTVRQLFSVDTGTVGLRGIERVKIPRRVIEAFIPQMTTTDSVYYLNPTTNLPKDSDS